MLSPEEIGQVIAQYEKHGWTLRRVLLSRPFAEDLSKTFGKCPIFVTDFDALWFSRRSMPGSEAWELRRLTGAPFALIAVLDDAATEKEREEILRNVEENIAGTEPKPLSH